MRGFTLLEVVLVIALLAILAVTAIPQLTTQSAAVDAAARKVRSDIQFAQSLALNRGSLHGIEFISRTPYVLYEGTPATPITDPLTRQSFSEDLIRFGNSQVISSLRIEFDTLGLPVVGGGGSLTVQEGGQTRTISVNQSGHVSIQ